MKRKTKQKNDDAPPGPCSNNPRTGEVAAVVDALKPHRQTPPFWAIGKARTTSPLLLTKCLRHCPASIGAHPPLSRVVRIIKTRLTNALLKKRTASDAPATRNTSTTGIFASLKKRPNIKKIRRKGNEHSSLTQARPE